jgi:hypothetical protein
LIGVELGLVLRLQLLAEPESDLPGAALGEQVDDLVEERLLADELGLAG